MLHPLDAFTHPGRALRPPKESPNSLIKNNHYPVGRYPDEFVVGLRDERNMSDSFSDLKHGKLEL